MDVALTTPIAEGRQGADSKERPAEARRSSPEPHFWEKSGSSLGYQASEDTQYWEIPWPNRRDWFPGGRGARGDILRKAE